MTHLHPAVLSPSSPLPRPMDFAFDASSSSTISCGLIVMCTTFDVSGLNLHAMRSGVLAKCIVTLTKSSLFHINVLNQEFQVPQISSQGTWTCKM